MLEPHKTNRPKTLPLFTSNRSLNNLIRINIILWIMQQKIKISARKLHDLCFNPKQSPKTKVNIERQRGRGRGRDRSWTSWYLGPELLALKRVGYWWLAHPVLDRQLSKIHWFCLYTTMKWLDLTHLGPVWPTPSFFLSAKVLFNLRYYFVFLYITW